MSDDLLSRFGRCLGAAGCLAGADVPASCRSDATGTGTALPRALLRPASTAEVAAALALCHAAGQAVVPQGGMTGLAGGANPRHGDIALSLDRFAGIEALDPVAGTMTLRAGTVLATAQAAAEAAGWVLPVDLGARGSARIGGLIATNAGGLRVLRYGTLRENVLGLEAALADGTVLCHLNAAMKDNTGLDLRQLMIGSEGILGVITRAVIRLYPRPRDRHTALCALPAPEAAAGLLARMRRDVTLSAFEVMWPSYYRINAGLEGLRAFAEPPEMVALVEAEAPLEPVLEAAFEDGLVSDAVIAQSLADAEKFWAVREGHRIDAALPGLINFDVSLPIPAMPGFVATVSAGIGALHPGAAVHFFGHLADGNLHALLHAPGAAPAAIHAMEAALYDAVRDLGGSVSAEHGIGTLKRGWLGHSRSPAERAAMRAIKQALDPKGILNPGKVL